MKQQKSVPKPPGYFTKEALKKANEQWEQALTKRHKEPQIKRNNRTYHYGEDHHFYGITPKKHPYYDHTVYHFQHEGGELFIGHQHEFRKKYDIHPSSLSLLVNGKQNSHKGWVVARRKKDGNTALMRASKNGKSPKTITTLIASGEDVNARDEWGNTVLMTASANNKNPAIIAALITNGADVNARDKNDNTALMVASLWNKNPDVVTTLIAHGADVNAQDQDGETPLMWAAKRKNRPEIITTLITHGADIHAKDHQGKTAWDYIQKNNRLRGSEAYKILQEENKS